MRGSTARWIGGLAIGGGAILLAIFFSSEPVPTTEPRGAPRERVTAESEAGRTPESHASRGPGGQAPSRAAGPVPTESTESPPRAPGASDRDEEPSERRLDEGLLGGQEMRDGDVAWMRERFDAAERERTRLREAAEAEGRQLTWEERQWLWQFETELEQKIGSENYDRLLYAAGEYNRVRVRVVAPKSPASDAGFEAGDFIVRYGGVPTYRHGHVLDLLFATENETSVPIEVMRGGELVKLTLDTGSAYRPPSGRIFGLSVTRDREAP